MAPTVLVVEDESKLRELVRLYLERDGLEVLSSASGAEAISVALRSKPDLMVLDLGLPDLAGEQVAREVRAAYDIPIVILTAMPLGAAERELLAGRTREVIAKGADDLAQVLRRILVRLPKAAEVAAAG